MTGEAIVVKLGKLEKIEGADRIVQCKLLGETIIVSNDHQEGELGILFDCESALSPEYLKANNLYRHENLNSDTTKKGMFEDNGRVRPVRLRGVKVSAFWMPLNSLSFTLKDNKNARQFGLAEGDKFNEINGFKIVEKYIPKTREKGEGNKQQKAIKVNYVPTFKEHSETDHLLKSLNDIPEGDFTLTIKCHGTSLRYGKLQARKPTLKERLENRAKNPEERFLRRIVNNFIGKKIINLISRPSKEMEYRNVVGSRTVVKSVEGLFENPNKGFYDNDLWTKVSREVFKDNLFKGETVYAEIVGYDGDKSIMPSNSTKPLEKFLDKQEYKDFVSKYGDTVHYNYGVKQGEYDVYVYRITMTNEDGEAIDLSWEQVKRRCEKLGVKHVPEIGKGRVIRENDQFQMDFWWKSGNTVHGKSVTDPRNVTDIAEEIGNSCDHLGTAPEGFCLRTEGYPNCKIWKYKTYSFKILENLIKDKGITTVEEEESQQS